MANASLSFVLSFFLKNKPIETSLPSNFVFTPLSHLPFDLHLTTLDCCCVNQNLKVTHVYKARQDTITTSATRTHNAVKTWYTLTLSLEVGDEASFDLMTDLLLSGSSPSLSLDDDFHELLLWDNFVLQTRGGRSSCRYDCVEDGVIIEWEKEEDDDEDTMWKCFGSNIVCSRSSGVAMVDDADGMRGNRWGRDNWLASMSDPSILLTTLESATISMKPSWTLRVADTIDSEGDGVTEGNAKAFVVLWGIVAVGVILVNMVSAVVNLITTPSIVVRYSMEPGTIRVGRKTCCDGSGGGSSAGWGGRLRRCGIDIWQRWRLGHKRNETITMTRDDARRITDGTK